MGWLWKKASESILRLVKPPLYSGLCRVCPGRRPHRSQLKVTGAPSHFSQLLDNVYSLFLCNLSVSSFEFRKMLGINPGPGTRLVLNVWWIIGYWDALDVYPLHSEYFAMCLIKITLILILTIFLLGWAHTDLFIDSWNKFTLNGHSRVLPGLELRMQQRTEHWHHGLRLLELPLSHLPSA